MSVQLDLLRHGETELGGGLRGSLDDALTPLGWAQMRDAVKGGGPWDRIVSSPLQRCALFARELSAQLDIPLSFDKNLQELHFGAWEGQSAAALMQTDEQALGQKLLLARARGLPREQLLQVPVLHGAMFGLQVGADGELIEVGG